MQANVKIKMGDNNNK